jgi:hypothetical protein
VLSVDRDGEFALRTGVRTAKCERTRAGAGVRDGARVRARGGAPYAEEILRALRVLAHALELLVKQIDVALEILQATLAVVSHRRLGRCGVGCFMDGSVRGFTESC